MHHWPFDFRTVVKRSISYALLIAVIAIVFFSSEFLIEKYIDSNDEMVDIACAIGGAIAFSWFRSFFDRATDRIFFRGDYDYAEAVAELGPLLNETIDLKFLLGLLNDFLLRTIKPSRVVFILDGASSPMLFPSAASDGGFCDGGQEYLALAEAFRRSFGSALFVARHPADGEPSALAMARTLGVAAIIPLAAKESKDALLCLGIKRSGGAFAQKDVRLLQVLSSQAGMVIENARLYEEVRAYSEDLEARVAARTEEVTSMYEAQSKFLVDISHALQTPIAILRGNVEVLEQCVTPQTKSPTRVIVATLNSMARLVGSLLESARLKFSKNKFYKADVVVAALLEEVYEDCLILGEDKGVRLSFSSEEGIVVAGDKDKLKEVLFNLISNALKHTERGGAITLSGKRAADSGAADGSAEIAEIIVEDTGCGIPPENLADIFERFYRIDGDGIAGTGIGLHICRQIVEAHDGTIIAESEPGKGSRFTVRIPLKDLV